MPVDVRNIVLEVTGRCNNTCAHCYNYWRGNGSVFPKPLPRAEIRELMRKVLVDAPVEQVALSGGEPLMRSDLPAIAADLAGMGLRVVIITNGSLLTPSMLKRFPEGCVFEVTLFSALADIHDMMAGRRRHQRLLHNIASLRKEKFSLVVATVVTSRNTLDVTRTIELAIALRAEAVLLNRVNLGRQMFLHSPGLVPTAGRIRSVLEEANAAAKRYGVTVLVSVPIPPCVADPMNYPHLHFGWCPRGGKDAYYAIGPTGDVRPCNHSSVVLGTLKTSSFETIVNGRDAREFWRPVPAACKECNHPLRDSCRGGCPAAADECLGDRTRIDPFVDAAFRRSAGPFRQSRKAGDIM